jgi:hypothetical protein
MAEKNTVISHENALAVEECRTRVSADPDCAAGDNGVMLNLSFPRVWPTGRRVFARMLPDSN